MRQGNKTDASGKRDYTKVSAGNIKSLSHKELSRDERFQAAAQISATLFENPSSAVEASSWVPCVVRDGYVRSLVEVLQHVLCSADCAESARIDRRLWGLLARVLESESLDGDSLNRKLTIAARLGILHWSSEGKAEAVDGFAEDLLAVFKTIHARFTLSHFDIPEKWVELLQTCISSTLEFPRGSHLKQLIGFLAKECGFLQREDKPWFTPTLTKLLFPALQCIDANNGESMGNSLKSFLVSVLFSPLYLDDFRKFATGQVTGENPQWRSIDGSRTDKNNAGLFFKKLQSEIHGLGKTGTAALEGLPWMLDHLCEQFSGKDMESTEENKINLRFALFATFLAVALPSSCGNSTVGKKRKVSEPNSWVQNISAMEELLSVAIKTGAYRPTDSSAPLQMSVLQTVLDTVMAEVGPCLTSKRRKTGEGPAWDGATKAASGVVKKLLKMEHRVVHSHLEQILDLAFMEFPQWNSSSDSIKAGVGDMLGLLITAYSEVRQLDILLASVLTRLNKGETVWGKMSVAIPQNALGILSQCVWNAPPMQGPDLLKCVLDHFTQCDEEMSGNSIGCVGELVVCILQGMKVTLSEAVPIAFTIKEYLNGDLTRCPAARALEKLVKKNCEIRRSLLALVMLKVRSACECLYQSCALVDPSITSPLLAKSTDQEGEKGHSSETTHGLNDQDLFMIVEEINKQSADQAASLTWRYELEWRRVVLVCLMRKLHAVSLLSMKEKYISSDTSLAGIAMPEMVPNGTDSPAGESQGLTNAIFNCIPVESYDQICDDTAASSQLVFLSCQDSEILVSSWVDLCDSFLLWSTYASKEQIVGVLKRVISIGFHSLGKSNSEKNAVENATWRLLSDPDTFMSDSIAERFTQALGEVVRSVLGGLPGYVRSKATADTSNPVRVKDFFKKLSNKSTISKCVEFLNSQDGVDNSARSAVGNGSVESLEEGFNRLAKVFQMATHFPCARLGKASKLGLSIGLGTAVVLLRGNKNFQNSTFVKCCAGVLRWMALVCVKTTLKKAQLNFLIGFAGNAIRMGLSVGQDDISDILKSLGSLGLANYDQLESEDLDRVENECVRCALQVGVVRAKLQKLRGAWGTARRKSILESIIPIEKRCVADFEKSMALQNNIEHQSKILASWCLGSLCHSVAAFIRLHRVNSKQSTPPSKEFPPSIANVQNFLVSILESLSQERLSEMPSYCVVGLVDLLSVIGSSLGSFDPRPGIDGWVGLVRFHACILMSLPKPLFVDPTLQSSSLTDRNPIIIVDGENSEASEVRQAVVKNVVSLAHSVSRGVYDAMIRKILQALGDGSNSRNLHAWAQVLYAALSVGHPRSELRRKCLDGVINVMTCMSTSSRNECMDRGLWSSSVCCLVRTIVVLSRNVDRDDARSFALNSSRIGTLLFGWPEVRADSGCGPGIFVECCSVLDSLASKHTADVIHVCVAGLVCSFRTLLHSLVGWLELGVNEAVLVKCADSIGTAATRLAKVQRNLDSLGLDLVMAFVEAIANIKRLENVQGGEIVAGLTKTAVEVYAATNRLKRKSLFEMVDSEESRFVLDALRTEDSKRKKVRV